MAVILEAKQLYKRFGGLVATDHVDFRLETGARHALIGPNGAGKTTFVNLLSGALRPSSGSIFIEGTDATSASIRRRTQLGLARTFQINQLFAHLTPLETILFSIFEREGVGWSFLGSSRRRSDLVDEAVDIATALDLGEALCARVSSLPYGKRRLLEIAAALAMRPKALLLDEPAAGVPEGERGRILDALFALPPTVGLLLIEHDMDLVFRFANRISVLFNGALLVEGPPNEVAKDPRVRKAYLGSEHGDGA